MERALEERLRDAVCDGDTDAVQEFINLGVNINARQPVSGWTALHLACKKGRVDVVALLLKYGANKNLRTEKGETTAFLCSNHEVLRLLNPTDEEYRILHNSSHTVTHEPDFLHVATNVSKPKDNVYDEELVLKIRIANAMDPDFIEIELSRNELTYQALLCLCCKELKINPHQVQKLRKLPNTKLRKDRDIQRLQNFQEIEVVTDTTNVYNKSLHNINGLITNLPTLPANGYQSISKKDQTILY